MFKILLGILLPLSVGLSANARSDESGSLVVSVAGVVNDQVKQVQSGGEGNELNYGAGILVEANIRDQFGIETGALLVNRQYDVEKVGVRLVQEVKRVHIPILARYWPNDYLSVAAGPFLAFKTGDTKTSLSVGDYEVGSMKTSSDDSVEYGLDGAATLNFAINDKTGLFVEGRYSMILDKEGDENSDEFSGLAGVKLDL